MSAFLPKATCSLLLLLTTLLTLVSCKNSPKSPPPGPPGGAMEVTAIPVETKTLRLNTELAGRTAAFRNAEVRPQISGIVQKRLFTEGAIVKAGEVLYQIDPATYQASLASAEAALAKSEALEYSARLKATRYRTLLRTKSVSEQEQSDTEAAWKQMQAEVAAARAAVKNAKINLDYTQLKAPIAGRIGKSLVSEGALVTAQQAAALATIQQLDPLYVDVSQSTSELLRLKKDLAAQPDAPGQKIASSVQLVLDDGSLYSETGQLEFADATVDPSTGTVTIRAIVPNPGQHLLPGMYVRARLAAASETEAVLVPQASLIRNNRGQALVMLVNGEGKVEARPVVTGQNVGDKILIAKGLSGGEQLIVAGLQKIKPDMPVKIAPPAAAGNQTAAGATAPAPAKKAE